MNVSGVRTAIAAGLLAVATSAILAAPAAGDADGSAGGPGSTTAAAAKCKRAIVNGKRICLKIGDPCKKRFQEDYVRAGFSCKRGKLRKASIAELRGPEPLLIDENGHISLRTALAAFDLGVADLPGIKPRKGEIGPVEDATLAVNEILSSLPKLSPEQRAVVTSVTTPAPDAVVLPAEGPLPTARSVRAPEAAPARRASTTIVGSGTPEERIEAVRDIGAARTVLQGHGFPFPHDIKVSFLDRNKVINGRQAAAYVPFDATPLGTSPTCNVFVTKVGRASTVGFKRLMYAHELAHCTQQTFFTSLTQAAASPGWVIEGSADWLGGMAVAESGNVVEGVNWSPWLGEPTIDLFKRAYSAVGFFAMVHQASGGDGWQRVAGVLTASAGGSEPAYLRAWAGLPEIFHDRWGPGLARDIYLGPEWNYEGPGIIKSRISEATVGNRSIPFSIPAHSSEGVKLELSAEVIVLRPDKAIRGLMVSADKRYKVAKGSYCAKPGGCKCRTHANLQLPQLGKTAFLGFNALFKPARFTIEGRSLKDYCKKPTPGPGPSGPSSCPTGPPAARGGDTPSCPAAAAGVQVFGQPCDESGTCTLVATFRSADCTAGAGFTAIATDGAWRLEVGIQPFSGFASEYSIGYGGGPVNVVVDGPDGPYSNTTWAPPGLPFAGAVAFPAGTGSPVGVGWIEFRNASGAEGAGITGAGQMACAYPED